MSGNSDDMAALAKGGRTNVLGFIMRLVARIPFLFIAGRWYGPDIVGRFATATLAVEFAALVATLGLKRGLAQALTKGDQSAAHIAWDGLAVAFVAAIIVGGVLSIFPVIMFPNSPVNGLDQLLPLAVLAIAWTEVMLAALAYRHNVGAAVTARAIVEPWTISIAAFIFSFFTLRDGLILSYALSMLAALVAAAVPFLRAYPFPRGWSPRIGPLFALAKANAPLAGADAIEWGSRNIDRALLSFFFAPGVVGFYFMAQQISSLPQKLKTSFDPILGPVLTKALAAGDTLAVARAVKQVGFWIIAAQVGLALMFSIPAEGVMGIVGPQFVAGALALVFLMWGEVAAIPGSTAESALVYMARNRNLMISALCLALQIALSLLLLDVAKRASLPVVWQAAAPAIALFFALGIQSLAKSLLLKQLAGASVTPFRWTLLLATAIAAAIGGISTTWIEWAEIIIGIPLIAATYLFILWKIAFKADDRALFAKAR